MFDVRPQEEDRFSLDSLIRALPALLDRLVNEPRFLLWIEIDSLLPPWNIRQDVFEAYVEDSDDGDSRMHERESDEDEEADDIDRELEEDDSEDDRESSEREEEPITEPSDIVLEEEAIEPVTPWTDPPTGPFDVADPDSREWLHWSLAALVTGLDAELGVIFDQIRARGLDRTAAWLLTSDFGCPLGEHGQIGRHRPWLHEELVHLPLILRLSNAEEACRRIPAFTQPPDIAPTVLDLMGLPHDTMTGTSLVPVARGRGTVQREFAITKLEFGAAAELAIRTDDWALLVPVRLPEGETRESRLYAKPDDRWEVNDLRGRNIDRADELEERLRQMFETRITPRGHK